MECIAHDQLHIVHRKAVPAKTASACESILTERLYARRSEVKLKPTDISA